VKNVVNYGEGVMLTLASSQLRHRVAVTRGTRVQSEPKCQAFCPSPTVMSATVMRSGEGGCLGSGGEGEGEGEGVEVL